MLIGRASLENHRVYIKTKVVSSAVVADGLQGQAKHSLFREGTSVTQPTDGTAKEQTLGM